MLQLLRTARHRSDPLDHRSGGNPNACPTGPSFPAAVGRTSSADLGPAMRGVRARPRRSTGAARRCTVLRTKPFDEVPTTNSSHSRANPSGAPSTPPAPAGRAHRATSEDIARDGGDGS